jgi:hypothetical protein
MARTLLSVASYSRSSPKQAFEFLPMQQHTGRLLPIGGNPENTAE